VRALLEDRRVTFDKTRHDLRYQPLPLATGLGATLQWLAGQQVLA
jgi:hypothetical protein